MLKSYLIRGHEVGLLFRNDEFVRLLTTGRHVVFDPLGRVKVTVASRREPWLSHAQLDLIIKSGALAGHAETLELRDHQRALVWIDDRFSRILGPGQYVYWTGFKAVRTEIIDIRKIRFEHEQFKVIARASGVSAQLETVSVARDRVGVLYIDGQYVETLAAGDYAFWRYAADVKVVEVDRREATIDIAGQDVMTADKVTLRLNAMVNYRIVDAHRAVSQSEDAKQTLYREAQLALRAMVGARELDAFLAEKDAVGNEALAALAPRAEAIGLRVVTIGIRDIILPGDMKDLMNKVTEARKAAEANLILRREETAAIRSQANTAKLLAENPMLLRLRELETLEKVASSSKLQVVLGEKGLADKIVNLI